MDGGTGAEPEAMAMGRVGEMGRRGDGGVTSVCSIELKMALACSVKSQRGSG